LLYKGSYEFRTESSLYFVPFMEPKAGGEKCSDGKFSCINKEQVY